MIEKIQQKCPEVPPILFKNLVRPHFFPKKPVHLLYAALDFLDQKSRYSIKSKEDNLEQLIVTAVSIWKKKPLKSRNHQTFVLQWQGQCTCWITRDSSVEAASGFQHLADNVRLMKTKQPPPVILKLWMVVHYHHRHFSLTSLVSHSWGWTFPPLFSILCHIVCDV